MDGSGKRLKSQMADTNSISGTIVIQNNCNNSQLSSPDMSEANEMHRYSSSSMNLATATSAPPTTTTGNDDKDDKHKLSLLKIPGVIKTEQQAVRFYLFTHIFLYPSLSLKLTKIATIFFVHYYNTIHKFLFVIYKFAQQSTNSGSGGEYLSPPSSARRRSSVMFNDLLFLHTPPNEAQTNKNISQVEKTTQTGDGNIWKVQ